MGARRVTLKDVAVAAGVSSPQASLALSGNGRVAAETSARVREAARRLGYRPNPVARALRLGGTGAVGLITRNLSNSYFLDVIRGMEAELADHDSHVIVMDSGYDEARELAAVQRMAASGVNGLAIAPIGDTRAVDWWRENRPESPLVLINAAPVEGVRTVGPDNTTAVRLAVEQFSELGHDRVAFVSAPARDAADTDRTEAFLRCVADRGITGEILESRLHFDDVRQTIDDELSRIGGARTFLMNSDYTASAVYRSAISAELTMGRELSVIGHDDIPTSALLAPPMTTIAFDRRAVGGLAAATLLDPEGAPAQQIVPVRLVGRDSVADLRGR